MGRYAVPRRQLRSVGGQLFGIEELGPQGRLTLGARGIPGPLAPEEIYRPAMNIATLSMTHSRRGRSTPYDREWP
jgi:hypothetical protein